MCFDSNRPLQHKLAEKPIFELTELTFFSFIQVQDEQNLLFVCCCSRSENLSCSQEGLDFS